MNELIELRDELTNTTSKGKDELSLRRFRHPLEIMPKILTDQLSDELQLDFTLNTPSEQLSKKAEDLFIEINSLIPDQFEVDIYVNRRDADISIVYQENGCYTPVNFTANDGESIITQLKNYDWEGSFGQSLELNQKMNTDIFERHQHDQPHFIDTAQLKEHMPSTVYSGLLETLKELLKKDRNRFGVVYLDASYLIGNTDTAPPSFESYSTRKTLLQDIPNYLVTSHQPYIIILAGVIQRLAKVDRIKHHALENIDKKSIGYLNATYQM